MIYNEYEELELEEKNSHGNVEPKPNTPLIITDENEDSSSTKKFGNESERSEKEESDSLKESGNESEDIDNDDIALITKEDEEEKKEEVRVLLYLFYVLHLLSSVGSSYYLLFIALY